MFQRLLASWKILVGGGDNKPVDLPEAEGERRVWVRYPCELKTTFQPEHPLPDSAQLSAKVQDVSRGGINLLVDKELDPGLQLLIELPDADQLPAAIILAYLMRVTPLKNGEYALGCTFATELGEADLAPFGAKLVHPSTPDKRSWVRFRCDCPATFQIIRTGESHRSTAQAVDLSANGMGLVTGQMVEVGTTLSVELRGAKLTLSLLACVVRAKPDAEGKWHLGCNFIRELSDPELQAWIASSESDKRKTA